MSLSNNFHEQYEGKAVVDFYTISPTLVELSHLSVSKRSRTRGHASAALKLITRLADESGVTIELEIGGEDFGIDGDADLLVDFYKRYGFKFMPESFGMIRKPNHIKK